jgi:hypothetical protein
MNRRQTLARILLIILILSIAALACVDGGGGGGGGGGSWVNDSPSIQATATYGAEQFHIQLTAEADPNQ